MEYNWGKLSSPWLHETPDCWGTLFENSRSKIVKKNAVLIHEGDKPTNVYLIRRGRFRITSYQEDGNEKQLCIGETGSIFGEQECITGSLASITALAIVESEVSVLSCAEFMTRISGDINLMRRVMEFETRKCCLLQRQVLSLSFASATTRIARTLLDLYHMYGEDTPQGSCIKVRFTKNELAGLVGTSRVTVSSELMKLVQQGLLLRRQPYYFITDLEALARIASE